MKIIFARKNILVRGMFYIENLVCPTLSKPCQPMKHTMVTKPLMQQCAVLSDHPVASTGHILPDNANLSQLNHNNPNHCKTKTKHITWKHSINSKTNVDF